MNPVLAQIEKIGIVPVIRIDDVEHAVPLAKALAAGGIPCAEITFRTAHGVEAIRRITAQCPDVLTGAGTVTSTQQVDQAIDAGAKFVVSPGFNPKVVRYCLDKGMPITPGCSTTSDLEQALEFGLEAVKFFPAEQSGGLDYIKAVSAPYNTLRFMPTGGISAGNIAKYLAFDKIIACGGSWMVKPELLQTGKFDEVTRLCKEALGAVLGFSLAHVGLHAENREEALRAAKLFEAMFGFKSKEGDRAVFAGTYVEVTKAPEMGKHGHIAIATASVLRARAFLERQGFAFREDTLELDKNGNPTAIYLQDEILGFAIHLQK